MTLILSFILSLFLAAPQTAPKTALPSRFRKAKVSAASSLRSTSSSPSPRRHRVEGRYSLTATSRNRDMSVVR